VKPSTAVLLFIASLPTGACFRVPDQGITSETHRTHVGGMVFSHAVIQHGAEDPVAFVESCTLGQPCYGRFYLPLSLHDSAHTNYVFGIALRASVDGTAMPEHLFAMDSSWSTYNFTLFRAANDGVAWEHPKWFLEQVARRLPPGEHRLEMAVLAAPDGRQGTGEPIATGRITFVVPPNAPRIIAGALARENQLLAAAAAEARRQQAASQAEVDRQAAENAAAASNASSSEQPSEAPVTEAPKPSRPACLPDGALTDSWNKCCGGHWRGTANDFHCCSQVGGGDSTATACY
jgi:hypothetical protein